MKRIISTFIAFSLVISAMSTVTFASEFSPSSSRYEYIDTEEISLPITVKSVNKSTAKIHIYNDNGIKVYKLECADSPEIKMLAFEALNNFMDMGVAERTEVGVNLYNQEFYGNERGYGSNSNAIGYTWARYVAGNVQQNGYDSTWGGQSAIWAGTGTADYIKLHQSVTINVTNADASLSISWPPALTISQSRTSSTATWVSEPDYNSTGLGAEHAFTEFDLDDIQNGVITSCVYSDSGEVKFNSTIYRPTTSVKFNNEF